MSSSETLTSTAISSRSPPPRQTPPPPPPPPPTTPPTHREFSHEHDRDRTRAARAAPVRHRRDPVHPRDAGPGRPAAFPGDLRRHAARRAGPPALSPDRAPLQALGS